MNIECSQMASDRWYYADSVTLGDKFSVVVKSS